jgi:hypothetical protein
MVAEISYDSEKRKWYFSRENCAAEISLIRLDKSAFGAADYCLASPRDRDRMAKEFARRANQAVEKLR